MTLPGGGQVRKERVLLEDEPDGAAMRRRERAASRCRSRFGAAIAPTPAPGRYSPAIAAQDRRLAAAGRSEDGQHVARVAGELDVERDRAGLPQADRQPAVSHGGAQRGATSAVVAISVATAMASSVAAIDAGAPIVERLHAIVDGDAQRARLARQVAAHHQHDAELAERVRKRQDRGGQDARPGERELDPQEALPRRQAAAGRGVTHVGRNGLEAALDRLDDERDVGDRGREQQSLERERQRLADETPETPAPSGERAPKRHEQVEPEHASAAAPAAP